MNFRHKLALALVDVALLSIGIVLALALRLDFEQTAILRYFSWKNYLMYAGVVGLAVFNFSLFGLYGKVWRYAGVHELLSIFYAVTLTGAFWESLVLFQGGVIYPRTCPVIAGLLWLAGSGGTRFLWRIYSTVKRSSKRLVRRALVVGVEENCEVLIRELDRENSSFLCVGFVDNQSYDPHLRIHGVPFLGNLDSLPSIIEDQEIQAIIMAGVFPAMASRVVQICTNLPDIKLYIMPSFSDVVEGNVQISRMRDVQIEDLLERDPVDQDKQNLVYLQDKVVLVTGAGGSIGSEICRQTLALGARQVILLGRGENSIYEIGIELRDKPVVQVIVDMRDRVRLERVFKEYHPQIVFHAAAHKHVPLMELNPAEAISNNVMGSWQVIDLARQYGVEKLISISTDKAVNPTSVMGATKRIIELILASKKIPGFAAVRFGNVLGSRGSVIPTFKRQISNGGPVTVTHEEMTRFFMTIPEAVALVLQAGAMAQGGEIYVLDMGKPVKIIDLARNLIRLSGFEPDVDIPIQVVGLRPGEKLYEELTNTGEETEPTTVCKITKVIGNISYPEDWFEKHQAAILEVIAQADDARALRLLEELIPNFKHK